MLDPYQPETTPGPIWKWQCYNLYLSNIKYIFYRNTSILLIDTTYVIQNVVSHICDTKCTLVETTFVTS